MLVHFLGHGGRYIWRTGPPDYRKNHDLFTLEEVDRLSPTTRLPLILSMTCYSAPFDHPTADSIGEKLLREPGRGAIAVLAASWRNKPTGIFSHLLVDRLMTPGSTIGEAIMRAKRRLDNRLMVETYNLLGDPALALAIPQHRVTLEGASSETAIRVSGRIEVPGLAGGRLLVDWLDEAAEVLYVQEQAVQGGRFAVEYPISRGQPRPSSAQVYVWNPQARVDALGAVRLVSAERSPAQTSAAQTKESEP